MSFSPSKRRRSTPPGTCGYEDYSRAAKSIKQNDFVTFGHRDNDGLFEQIVSSQEDFRARCFDPPWSSVNAYGSPKVPPVHTTGFKYPEPKLQPSFGPNPSSDPCSTPPWPKPQVADASGSQYYHPCEPSSNHSSWDDPGTDSCSVIDYLDDSETDYGSESSYIPAETKMSDTNPTISEASNFPAQPEPTTEADPDNEGPQLVEEQRELVVLMCRPKTNVCFTGSAGCGKSVVLRAGVRELRRMRLRVEVVAPTGCAALGVQGRTLHSFMGLKPHMNKPFEELKRCAFAKLVLKRLLEIDVLIIEEISMVLSVLFDLLDAMLQAARGNNLPFGGIKIIVTGDFCQLAPVKPYEYCPECGEKTECVVIGGRERYGCPKDDNLWKDENKWAFRSKAWEKCNFEYVNLVQVHRQQDLEFKAILQKLRTNKPLTFDDKKLLLKNKSVDIGKPIHLYPTRGEVFWLNQKRFNQLRCTVRVFRCWDGFRWGADEHKDDPVLRELIKRDELKHNRMKLFKRDNCPYDATTIFKLDQEVLLVQNLDLENGLANGSQGQIVGWEEYNPMKLPVPRDSLEEMVKSGECDEDAPTFPGDFGRWRRGEIRRFMENAKIRQWPIVRFRCGVQRTIFADCLYTEYGDEKNPMLIGRTQIPLIAGWAITIHKSQGMTLDSVQMDLTKAFAEGQAYVALSRAKSLAGLKVTALPRNMRSGNQEVMKFLREKFPGHY